MIVDVEPVPPLLTSRWCMASPVAHVGFKIEGLRGDSEYIDIKVRGGQPRQAPPLALSRPDHPSSDGLWCRCARGTVWGGRTTASPCARRW